MKKNENNTIVSILFFLFFLLHSNNVLAFQEHSAPEGFYIHQLAHVFFGSTMLWLYFMIRKSHFWEKQWWKSIATGALFLTLWNLATFSGHFLSRLGFSACHPDTKLVTNFLFWLWFLTKLDNLICILAMIFFYKGLKELFKNMDKGEVLNMKASGLK